MRRHVGECAPCRQLTAELLRSFSPEAPLSAHGERAELWEVAAEASPAQSRELRERAELEPR